MSRDPSAVLRSVARVLQPGGLFISESGGDGNVASVVGALSVELDVRGLGSETRNPWFFPTAETYTGMLRAAGFRVLCCELVERPTRLPCDMAGWLKTFSGAWLTGVEASEASAVLEGARTTLAHTQLGSDDGVWTVDYVRLRVVAEKIPA